MCAASKVYVNNEKLKNPSLNCYFKFLDNSDRFCHMIGDVEHFIIALNDDKFKTFMFISGDLDLNYPCINLIQLRKTLKTLLSVKFEETIDNTLSIDTLAIHDNPNKDVVNFTILLCSIGLPVFQMFSIEDLLKSWHQITFLGNSQAETFYVLLDTFYIQKKFSWAKCIIRRPKRSCS